MNSHSPSPVSFSPRRRSRHDLAHPSTRSVTPTVSAERSKGPWRPWRPWKRQAKLSAVKQGIASLKARLPRMRAAPPDNVGRWRTFLIGGCAVRQMILTRRLKALHLGLEMVQHGRSQLPQVTKRNRREVIIRETEPNTMPRGVGEKCVERFFKLFVHPSFSLYPVLKAHNG